jgi:hypothetical protein
VCGDGVSVSDEWSVVGGASFVREEGCKNREKGFGGKAGRAVG